MNNCQMSQFTTVAFQHRKNVPMNKLNRFDTLNRSNTLPNDHDSRQLIQAYGDFIHNYIAYGWHGYLLSFMFSQIPGSDQAKMDEMKKHLGWFYGRLAKASVPKASSPKWSDFLPKAILVPDSPVPKHSKVNLEEVTINNGVHFQGLLLTNPLAPTLQEPLDVHIKKHPRKYLVGSIREIGVQQITHDPEYVTEYGLKSLKTRFSSDEIIIFPGSVSELPSK
jgi:hypothetical protein